MRRKDREITDLQEILSIMKKCDVCRIAFFDEDYPYIIPMNYGFSNQDGETALYFHCALSGKKLDLLRSNPNVGFEMDCSHNLIIEEADCNCTMEFESICGNGTIEILPEDLKVAALSQLMKQYKDAPSYHFEEKYVKAIEMLKLTVHSMTGKRLKRN
jgi:Predicted flavin-nucleotide-binding protein